MSRIQNKKTGVRLVTIDTAQEHRRIDNFLLAELHGLPRSRIYQMLRRGEIRVNGGRVRQQYRLCAGDQVRIPPVLQQQPESAAPPAYLLQLIRDRVLYEDGDLLVLNKPAGVALHGGSGRTWGVIELLRCLRPADRDLQLVHRLDQGTSGCLLLARSRPALMQLHEAFRAGTVAKHYTALLMGRLDTSRIQVAQPLRRGRERSGERMVEVHGAGKAALSQFEITGRYTGATLVGVRLLTGRTHQIRVHAAAIGHPVAGDSKYGNREFNRSLQRIGLKRMFLHASRLRLPALPGMGRLDCRAPLPAELSSLLAVLGED